MNIAAHKTLYEDSIAFGTRETLMVEKGKADMEQRVKDINEFTTCYLTIKASQFLKKNPKAF